MKIQSIFKSKLLTIALLTVGVCSSMYGCKQVVDIIPAGQNSDICFVGSVNNAADSRLTQSDSLYGGVFEVGDSVGLFVLDQQGGVPGAAVYSYVNTPYIASEDFGRVVFSPAGGQGTVFYKTYFLHNTYAYFPYNIKNNLATSAPSLGVEVMLDQTTQANYAMSDFLTCRLVDIKPQQINPAAPELKMDFAHQFTSVVVKVRNSDNSQLRTTPVVSVVNTNTRAVVDITQATPLYKSRGTVAPVVLQQNLNYSDVNYSNQLCYFGIVIPQSIVVGQSLIKVKIGTGTSAQVLEYYPTATDAIFTSGGLVQGKEHVFDFVVKGTELTVQGGEIADWGIGTKSINTVDGEGKAAAKMIFDVINVDDAELIKMNSINSAQITIDGVVRTTLPFVYDQANKKITCVYYQGDDWGYDVTEVVFKDVNGATVMTCTPTTPLRIKGAPTDKNYSTVIAVIDARTSEITAK